MKRSNITRKTAMSPGKGFKQRAPIATTGIFRATAAARKAPARKATLKSKGPRMTPIRRAAQGQDCTLRIQGVCNCDPATTVLCHSNFLADGKGMGLKAPDTAAAFGCAACHDVLDGRRPRPEGYALLDLEGDFYLAVRRTHHILARMGLLSSKASNDCESPDASIKTTNGVNFE